LAGDVWSSKQIYVNEPNAISTFGAREGDKHIIVVLASSGKYYKYSFTDGNSECVLESMSTFAGTLTG